MEKIKTTCVRRLRSKVGDMLIEHTYVDQPGTMATWGDQMKGFIDGGVDDPGSLESRPVPIKAADVYQAIQGIQYQSWRWLSGL